MQHTILVKLKLEVKRCEESLKAKLLSTGGTSTGASVCVSLFTKNIRCDYTTERSKLSKWRSFEVYNSNLEFKITVFSSVKMLLNMIIQFY